jgi:hypothetical protein
VVKQRAERCRRDRRRPLRLVVTSSGLKKSCYLMVSKHNHAHRSWGRPLTRSIWLGAALCGLCGAFSVGTETVGRQQMFGLLCLRMAWQYGKAHPLCKLTPSTAQKQAAFQLFYSHIPQMYRALSSPNRTSKTALQRPLYQSQVSFGELPGEDLSCLS